MSGYRTLHRESPVDPFTYPHNNHEVNNIPSEPNALPLWYARICRSPSSCSTQINEHKIPSRKTMILLTSCADGLLRSYTLLPTSENGNKNAECDASLFKLTLSCIYLPTINFTYPISLKDRPIVMGITKFDLIRNHKHNVDTGDCVLVSLRLNGHVYTYLHTHKSKNDDELATPTLYEPTNDFHVDQATGTTLSLFSPTALKLCREYALLIAVGCLDGSVRLISTGVSLHSTSRATKKLKDKGTVVHVLGGGSGTSVPTGISIRPDSMDLAVGRKDGLIDLYTLPSSSNFSIKYYIRSKRITVHAGLPVRALSYTPDAALLLIGGDDGQLSSHDVSSNNTARMTGLMTKAHGIGIYILTLISLGDSRRFVSAGSDGSVKVWDVTSLCRSVHTFDGHRGMIWGLGECVNKEKGRWGGRPKEGESTVVSVGEDGLIQLYSC